MHMQQWIAIKEHVDHPDKIQAMKVEFIPNNQPERNVRVSYEKELVYGYQSECSMHMSAGTFAKIISGEPTDLPEKGKP